MMSGNEQVLDHYLDYEIKRFRWIDIETYLEQIINMQFENIYKFHYPDRKPNKNYVREKILELEKHLQQNNNTYFIGAIKKMGGGQENNLFGYIWCYESIFIDEKRMNINSIFIDNKARGIGLGQKLMKEIKKIAAKNGCDAMATHYAVFNKMAEKFYLNNGFKTIRAEVVCGLGNY